LPLIYHYSPLFETVRHYSHYSRLFVLFALRYSGLFAVRYSRLFAIRYSGFPHTPLFVLFAIRYSGLFAVRYSRLFAIRVFQTPREKWYSSCYNPLAIVCYSYVFYVTNVCLYALVCYSYVIVCYSYVLVFTLMYSCYSYVTRVYSYVTRMYSCGVLVTIYTHRVLTICRKASISVLQSKRDGTRDRRLEIRAMNNWYKSQ